MSDWNPQVVVIEKVEKHPDADALDIATVLGDYPVITKRNEYQVGELSGYLPIDTIVPDRPEFYFLCPKAYEKYEEEGEIKSKMIGPKYPIGSVPEKYRVIKAKKIRGIYSQGMLVQVANFYDINASVEKEGAVPKAGDSLVDLIGLKKLEEEEEENLPSIKRLSGINAEKPPQGWAIPHYDIDGVRKYLNCLLPGEQIVLTEKLHGSNAAFSHDGERLWVKSRNYYKKMDEDDMWWDIAIRYDLESKLKPFPGLVFFGEVYGQVKGFRYDAVIVEGRLLPNIRFFDVFDTKTMRYFSYQGRLDLLVAAELDAVPELYRGEWLGKEAMYPYAEGMSTLNPKHVREGWVLNTLKERYEPKLDSRMQVKLVGEGYNLQK